MKKPPIILYGIGGLGADHRVFKYLNLDYELQSITWINPLSEESLSEYANRITNQIDQSQKFGLIGVSFGGMLAIEMNQIVTPEFTILISSASKSSDLPRLRHFFKRFYILKFIPTYLMKPPFIIMKYLFGAKNSKLLKEIIDDTEPEFIRWALSKILSWDSNIEVKNLYQIHGTQDRLLPNQKNSSIIIKGGGHFMIVDEGRPISKILNGIVERHSA